MIAGSTWTLIDYFDVWGNAEDGWEVNNQSVEFDDIYIDPSTTDEELVDYLKSIGYLAKHVKTSDLEIYDDGDMIEFFKADDGMPICRLQRNFEY